jgi:Helix-turn-helix domain
VEHREVELHEVATSGVPDDPARFLRELRHLRNGAGLGHAELAARAHFPCDAILAAEAGPALPDLPVLSAYVRGCGGPVIEWEERWRTLTRSPALTLLPTREAGCSDAAAAGARVGSVSLAADGHDPAIIMAALGRVATGIAAEPVSSPSPFFTRTAAAPAAAPEPAFTLDSTPAADSVLGADWAPGSGSGSGSGGSAVAAGTRPADSASTPGAIAARDEGGATGGAAAKAGWTPTVVKPASATGHPRGTRRRPVSARQLIAAIAVLACLIVTFWALFS